MEPMEALHEIVAADRQAREKLAAAQSRDRDFDGDMEKLRRELAEREMARANADVEKARANAVEQAQEALAGLDRQYNAQRETLQRRFAENREACTEKLFRMVVGLDE